MRTYYYKYHNQRGFLKITVDDNSKLRIYAIRMARVVKSVNKVILAFARLGIPIKQSTIEFNDAMKKLNKIRNEDNNRTY